jgi:energy-coupling factor transport system ATP-binding protein
MIVFDHVTVRYADADEPSLRDVTLEIPEGELVLVVGPTGSGKSDAAAHHQRDWCRTSAAAP